MASSLSSAESRRLVPALRPWSLDISKDALQEELQTLSTMKTFNFPQKSHDGEPVIYVPHLRDWKTETRLVKSEARQV